MHTRVSFDSWTLRLLAALSLPTTFGCTSASPGPSDFKCTSPKPLVAGAETGYEVCANGFMHRAKVVTCANSIPRATDACPAEAVGPNNCRRDEDCAGTPNGFCGGEFDNPCVCVRGCTTDAECSAGQICQCGEPIGRCVPAQCKSDADCNGGLCATGEIGDPGCADTTFVCQTPSDECVGNDGCPESLACSIDDGVRTCVEVNCMIGRPFLVQGTERLAPPAGRADWLAGDTAPDTSALDGSQREALAEHWTRAGLMEHASIAAFARFALQLLSLGAPPDLVQDAQAAMGDETEHARLCFAMASAYAGRAIGPARLPIQGALEDDDTASMVACAILEGCVGETVAALEAAEIAARAVDPVVRAVSARIAEDETRHAELAWRFVRWALSRDASLRAVVAQTFASAIAAAERGQDTSIEDPWLALGCPSEAWHQALRHAALLRVVRPCAQALVQASGSALGHSRFDLGETAEDRVGADPPVDVTALVADLEAASLDRLHDV